MFYLSVFVLSVITALTHATNVCNELYKPKQSYIAQNGDPSRYRGWVDVQGLGVNNDYCRVIGPSPPKKPYRWLSCALAGTRGQEYQWPNSGVKQLDLGYTGTEFMMDVNGDGRADYCRCVGNPPKKWISCMLAGVSGFRSDQHGHSLWKC